jgi:ArsR family transcriptional regulator
MRDLQRLTDVREINQKFADAYFTENARQWDDIRSMHVDDEVLESKLLKILPYRQDMRLLDIGTGTGRVLELFGPLVSESVGIDCSREMLAIARTRIGAMNIQACQVRQGDMYQLPMEDSCFDIATIHLVLHYADDPAAVISEAARILMPNSVLAIVDFAPHHIEELRDKHAHRRLGFSDKEISELFSLNGLKVAEVHSLPSDPLTVKIWIGQKIIGDRALRNRHGSIGVTDEFGS